MNPCEKNSCHKEKEMSATPCRYPKLYVEPCAEHLPKGHRMTNDAYANATANLIIVSTDAVIIDSARMTMWLAVRAQKPADKLWWWIGGTLRRGFTAEDGMAEKFFAETALRVDPTRFEFIAMVRYWWKDRAQEPEDTGSDNLAYTYYIELSPEDRAVVAANLDANEYDRASGLREFTREDLVHEGVHPVIVDVYDAIFPPSERDAQVLSTLAALHA